jgi:TRAP-type C4-dicarboxylate transport system substrate-binding protein
MYTSVERGVVDGVVNHAPVCFVFGAWDLLKSHTYFGEGGISMGTVGVVWSNDTYNALPDDIKKIVDDGAQVWYDTFMGQEGPFMDQVMGIAYDRGDTFVNLTPEEIGAFREAVKGPVLDKWLEEATAKGLPAQAVYDRALELAESYQ